MSKGWAFREMPLGTVTGSSFADIKPGRDFGFKIVP